MATLKEKLRLAGVKVEDLRRQLVSAEAEFDSLYKQACGKKKSRNGADGLLDADLSQVDTDPDTSLSQIDALLNTEPSKEWDYQRISSLLSIPRPSVRVLLYKLKKSGRAEKIGRGKWKGMKK